MKKEYWRFGNTFTVKTTKDSGEISILEDVSIDKIPKEVVDSDKQYYLIMAEEKAEKAEKTEKTEKTEKAEKAEKAEEKAEENFLTVSQEEFEKNRIRVPISQEIEKNRIRVPISQEEVDKIEIMPANKEHPTEPVEEEKKEMVNHPIHYGGDTEYECIKVLKAWMTKDEFIGFCKGNALKYLCRSGKKDEILQEYNKAKWYIEKMIERIKYND